MPELIVRTQVIAFNPWIPEATGWLAPHIALPVGYLGPF